MKIRLIDFGGKMPKRAHENDAGADVFSPVDQMMKPGQICTLPLGFGIEIPDGMAGYIFPRSGLSSQGIVCEVPPIDSGYRGEVHAILSNVGNEVYQIKAGDRVGQLVIMPIVLPEFTYIQWEKRGREAFGLVFCQDLVQNKMRFLAAKQQPVVLPLYTAFHTRQVIHTRSGYDF